MSQNPTYKELEQRIKLLERKIIAQSRKKEVDMIKNHHFEMVLSDIHCISYRCLPDKNWTMKYLSPYMNQLVGYPSSDFINNSVRTYSSIIHPDDTEYVQQHVKEGIASGKPWDIEYRLYHQDNSICWVYEKGHAVTLKDSGKQYLDGFIIDITERKMIEEEYKRSQEQYSVIMDSMREPIYICSKDCDIKYMNAAMIKRIGYDAKGEKCFKAIHGFTEPCPWCHCDAVNKGAPHQLNIVSPLDNTPYDVSATPIVSSDGTISILNVFRDITQIKKMEAQLRQAQKMEAIGTLAGGIAHDFNNILFPIMGYTEMLMQDIEESSPYWTCLDKIYSGSLRAKDLVRQILTFSRQESSELSLINMQPIIKEALKLIRSTIPSTIAIKHNISNKCGVIEADPTQIHQVIMNLMTNAYHAMKETGGELKVWLNPVEIEKDNLISPNLEPGPYNCLTITDTGMGMAPETVEKIFDPFFTTKEKEKGTGMGLSVVHGIVNRLKGAIQVNSEQGKGSEFILYFPLETSSFAQPVIQKKEIIKGGSEHIFLVDDEKNIIGMEKEMLERLGYQVSSYTNSIEALEAFRTTPDTFDLVITDTAMPDLSGDKLAMELIKIRQDIPILLCTGFSETMSEEKATSLGIAGFILKPILLKDLSQKIRQLLD